MYCDVLVGDIWLVQVLPQQSKKAYFWGLA